MLSNGGELQSGDHMFHPHICSFIQILLARDLLDVQAEGREYRESRFNLRVMLLHKGLLRPCTGITS